MKIRHFTPSSVALGRLLEKMKKKTKGRSDGGMNSAGGTITLSLLPLSLPPSPTLLLSLHLVQHLPGMAVHLVLGPDNVKVILTSQVRPSSRALSCKYTKILPIVWSKKCPCHQSVIEGQAQAACIVRVPTTVKVFTYSLALVIHQCAYIHHYSTVYYKEHSGCVGIVRTAFQLATHTHTHTHTHTQLIHNHTHTLTYLQSLRSLRE